MNKVSQVGLEYVKDHVGESFLISTEDRLFISQVLSVTSWDAVVLEKFEEIYPRRIISGLVRFYPLAVATELITKN